MDMDKIAYLQGIGFIIFVVFLCIVLYGYLYHLRSSEKKGIRNYEKYSNLVLDDSLEDEIMEPYPNKDSKAKKRV